MKTEDADVNFETYGIYPKSGILYLKIMIPFPKQKNLNTRARTYDVEESQVPCKEDFHKEYPQG
jgi:hypothetical protein